MFIISRAFKHRRQVLAAVTANSTSSIKQNIKHPVKDIFLILKRGEADESGMCVKGCGRELRVESRVWKWNWREQLRNVELKDLSQLSIRAKPKICRLQLLRTVHTLRNRKQIQKFSRLHTEI